MAPQNNIPFLRLTSTDLRVPENEAEHFRLLTEIHQLEKARENDGEWPDVVDK